MSLLTGAWPTTDLPVMMTPSFLQEEVRRVEKLNTELDIARQTAESADKVSGAAISDSMEDHRLYKRKPLGHGTPETYDGYVYKGWCED
jgi:hypothetical protein